MGYTTDFTGRFNVNPVLKEEHKHYLNLFSATRRMERNPDVEPVSNPENDPIRVAAGLPPGEEGGYFVGAKGLIGQDKDNSILEYNAPPIGQPGLWCDWVPNKSGTHIKWNGGEKFYYYVEWIEYLIKHFLEPWGYKLNGKVEWQGESPNDRGRIVIESNIIKTQHQQAKWIDD